MKRVLIFFVIVSIWSCKVYHTTSVTGEKYDMTPSADVEPDSDIQEMIAPYKASVDENMNEVIGEAEKELLKEQPECTLGNWAADAIFDECQVAIDTPLDFAVINYGGLRIPSIPQGEVTTGRIFELMPFDNALVILMIKGEVVEDLFELIGKNGGWPISKQVKATYNSSGELLELFIKNEKLDKDKIYYVAMSDYIANGGDKCAFFKGKDRKELPLLMRDAFINAVKKQKTLNAEVEGRIVVE